MNNHALYSEALDRFKDILTQAESLGLHDPTAVALATATPAGRPSVRMVLMRGWDERGFQFFTNTTSRKGEELAANPHAALCFHWEGLQRQIRIEGTVESTTDAESDAYWATRPRESRLGAWASDQSRPLDDRQTMLDRLARFEAKYPGDDIPRPEFWRGYRVNPNRIEFWHGLPARLHDRDVYELVDGTWTHHLLYP